jgi:vacuolar-type H+-ATPase subunit I/STV1
VPVKTKTEFKEVDQTEAIKLNQEYNNKLSRFDELEEKLDKYEKGSLERRKSLVSLEDIIVSIQNFEQNQLGMDRAGTLKTYQEKLLKHAEEVNEYKTNKEWGIFLNGEFHDFKKKK